MVNIKEKVAVVTGGSQGIGRATALNLASHGAYVVIIARNAALCEKTVQYINSYYPQRASYYVLDITNQEKVNFTIKKIYQCFGHIDILVNNAGVCSLSLPFEELSIENWNYVMNVNTTGLMYCVKAVIPILKKQYTGKIVNVTSLAGEVGGIATSADYVASKAAIIGITKSLARYLGPYKINVNAVAPGYVATRMTEKMSIPLDTIPLRRIATPDDIARGITFLASEDADYITGITLDINGGIYMK
ncbi:3-oxoacyl-ACP reductase FabG [Megasphaera paucivorans]|jgi:3-oxoacyl-[acyl-carrier protein] reductase|uniref:3-oxoacyl-[acyl-carrier-protein] reductase n=1 Tax=Megasphaera paucivorans TaxID=349095 RepID=A0A1H0B1H9_9FIRM|nr:3-oxoacyl-ACP reductase FabG [Megasphaera paucivorans]SDN39514.1 3-oxoacyl-[acyl-carrier-protein] reductase [Megasphaera paucivorans]